MKELTVELTVDELQDTYVELISFVENPANKSEFMYFSEDKFENFKAIDEDKRIVIGCAMMPNRKIVRKDAEGNPYFVFFSEETVRKCQELFFKKGEIDKTNVDHSVNRKSDVSVVESWIVEDPEMDKSKFLGYSDIPKGSWFVSYKVDNDELWQKIKRGAVQGFSVEGLFKQTVVNEDEKVETEMQAILDGCDSNYEKLYKLRKKLNI